MARITIAEDLQRVRALAADGSARQIRIDSRLSLGDIARSIDVDLSTVSKWELGDRAPRGDAALRYLRLLDRLNAAEPPKVSA